MSSLFNLPNHDLQPIRYTIIISYHNFPAAHTQYILNMPSIFEPNTYEEAIYDKN